MDEADCIGILDASIGFSRVSINRTCHSRYRLLIASVLTCIITLMDCWLRNIWSPRGTQVHAYTNPYDFHVNLKSKQRILYSFPVKAHH